MKLIPVDENGKQAGAPLIVFGRDNALESMVIQSRRCAFSECERNRDFRFALVNEADLGLDPNQPPGGVRRTDVIIYWEARLIDPELPSKGYKECLPRGSFGMKMPEGERPVSDDGEWHEAILNLLCRA